MLRINSLAANSRPISPVVYFIQVGKYVVKIGYTTNLKQRLKAFKTSSLIEDADVLLAIPGSRDLERIIHGMFDNLRIKNELFQYDRPLIGFIDTAKLVSPAAALNQRARAIYEQKHRVELAHQRKLVAQQKERAASLEFRALMDQKIAERQEKVARRKEAARLRASPAP